MIPLFRHIVSMWLLWPWHRASTVHWRAASTAQLWYVYWPWPHYWPPHLHSAVQRPCWVGVIM